jgi:hypothetical protein
VVKLAIASGVIGASAPPAIATSDSPFRIVAAAVAMESRPATQVDDIVDVFVATPSLWPMKLAAA